MKLINKALAATIMLAGAAPSLWAQKSEPQVKVVNDIKFSGYVMTQYQYSDQKDAESNSFNLRMVRMALEGRFFNDFYWKAQVQLNGNTSTLGSSPRLVDAFAEWQKYKEARIKIGQFKRPFSFENPMHPIDQGFMSYAQNITKLAGFSDRVGEQASNGRDIGVQLQGDLLPNANGRRVLHYQVGVFNGQGINMKDVDNRKDVIGGIWLMPVSGMRIGAFGWTGSYARTGTWTENGETVSGTRTVSRNRYAISGEYVKDDWTFRSEYIHSQGYGFSTTYQKDGQQKDCTINTGAGDKADGLYALLIAPVKKNKVHLKARYDMYRPKAEWSTAKTQYEMGADYCLGKNIKLNAEYVFVNDCTKDRSVEILQQTIDRFPERKSQVILIQHEHNKGLGGARHTAFAASRGRYIMHVDSDDLLPLDAVEKLVKAAEKSGADIVDGGFADWENGQATLFHPAAHDSHRTYQRKLLCQNITSNRIWGRIYRRDLLENHGIYSVEGIDYSEDYAVVARVMYFAKRYFIDEVVYYYRKDNITSYTHDISEKNLTSHFKACQLVASFIEQHDNKGIYRTATDIGMVNAYRVAAEQHLPLEKVDSICTYRVTHPVCRLCIALLRRGWKVKHVNLLYLLFRRIYNLQIFRR